MAAEGQTIFTNRDWPPSTLQVLLFVSIGSISFLKSISLPIIGRKMAMFEVLISITSIFLLYFIIKNGISVAYPTSLILIFITAFFSGAGIQNSPDPVVSALNLIILIYSSFIVVILFQIIHNRSILVGCIHAYVCASTITVLAGVLALVSLMMGIPTPLLDPVSQRVISTLREPNQVPAFLVSSFPFFLLYAYMYQGRGRITAVFISILTVLVIVGSGSDWGLAVIFGEIVLILVYIIYLTRLSRSGLYLAGIVLSTLIGMLLLVIYSGIGLPAPVESSISLFLLEQYSTKSVIGQSRYTQFFIGFPEAMKRYPLAGLGLGSFAGFMEEKLGPRVSMHNTFLGVFVGSGVIGGTSFILFILLLYKKIISIILTSDGYYRHLAATLAVSLAGLLAYQLAHYGLRWRHFWVLVAFVLSLQRTINNNSEPSQDPVWK